MFLCIETVWGRSWLSIGDGVFFAWMNTGKVRQMRFFRSICYLLFVIIGLLTVACDAGDKDTKVQVQENQVQRLHRQVQRLAAEQAALREKLVIAQGQIASARAQLDAAEATIKSLQAGVDTQDLSPLLRTLPNLARPKVAPVEKKGWPLPIKLMIVLAILIIVFLFFQSMTADDDEDDLFDDSFVEENDLGTVRYPDQEMSGSAGDDSEKSDSNSQQ